MAKVRIPGTRQWVEPDSEEALALNPLADDLPTDEEDWAAQAQGQQALDAVIDARVAEMRAEIRADIKAEILADLAAAQIAAQSKPSLAMRANVHDRFMEGSNNRSGQGTVLNHWRCDEAKSVKMVELDMDLLEAYESGEKERPTNDTGRPLSAVSLAVLPGSTIDWVDGHCYTYTENQNRNIERARKRAEMGLSGGMAGIYEDTGTREDWRCYVCPSHPSFTNRQTFDNHMTATHGVRSLVAA